MAVTQREEQILDLSEAGLKPIAIAAELGVSDVYVRATLNRFSGLGSNSFDKMVRRGSAALLAAIRLYHPERFTSEPQL